MVLATEKSLQPLERIFLSTYFKCKHNVMLIAAFMWVCGESFLGLHGASLNGPSPWPGEPGAPVSSTHTVFSFPFSPQERSSCLLILHILSEK